LISLGLRLAWTGTPEWSWRDLWVIVNQAPQGSALDRAMRPSEAPWGLPEQLAAAQLDAARVRIWQAAGGKPSTYPHPTPRPGVEPPTQIHGSAGMFMDQMRSWLGWDKSA